MKKQPTTREIVVYVVGILGGEYQRIHTEDIAIKCYQLFPDGFSWIKHKEFPDKDIVRSALTNARKDKHGALVTGRSGKGLGFASKTNDPRATDGWILTPAGVEWLKEILQRFESLDENRVLRDHRQEALRRLRRVFKHQLWKNFEEDQELFSPSVGKLADLLRCRVDASPAVWSKRLNTLKQDARAARRPLLDLFIEACQHAYEVQQ